MQVHDRTRAAFTQYPRPGIFPTLKPNSDEPKLQYIEIMGYSIITSHYRYTEWVRFNNKNCHPVWNITVDSELYDHWLDPQENLNLAYLPQLDKVLQNLKEQLRLGWRYAK